MRTKVNENHQYFLDFHSSGALCPDESFASPFLERHGGV